MNIELKKFSSGWVSLNIEMSSEDITEIITKLTQLESGEVSHFHFRTNIFGGDSGVADVAFSFSPESEGSDFSVE